MYILAVLIISRHVYYQIEQLTLGDMYGFIFMENCMQLAQGYGESITEIIMP